MQFYIATVFLLHGLSPVAGLAFGFFLAATWLCVKLFDQGPWLARMRFRRDDSLFGIIYILGLLPLLLNPSAIGGQNLIYMLLWPVIWFVCYWWIREWSLLSALRFADVSNAAALGCLLLSFALILEFILANSSGTYLSDIIPFSIKDFPQATVLDDGFNRPRGFSAEAGFTAIAFECLLPLSIYTLRASRLRMAVFALVVGPAYLMLFSAASFCFLTLTSIVFIYITQGPKRAFWTTLVIALPVTFVAITSEGVSFVFYEVIARKFLEFSIPDGGFTADTFSRPEAYTLGLDIITLRPFGIGWGTISEMAANGAVLFGTELKGSGLISLPLELGAAGGVPAMLLYVWIVWRKLRRLALTATLPARLVFFSLLWVSLHHIVVLEFWFPMLWLSMALADAFSREAPPREALSPSPSRKRKSIAALPSQAASAQ